MANNLPSDGNNRAVQALKPVVGSWQRIEFNTISGNKFNIRDAEIVRFRASQECYIAFGETVSSGCMVLDDKAAEYFHVTGFDRIEVLGVSTAGYLSKLKMDY